jgi:DNA-binding transcriptional ArsR family regulator
MNTLFKALNDQTRREILELLREKDLTAGEIAAHFLISKPCISHHLDLLRQAELVLA